MSGTGAASVSVDGTGMRVAVVSASWHLQVMEGLRAAGMPVRPAPWMVEALRPLAWSMAELIGARPILTTITEDMPDARNRVRSEDGRIVVEYSVDPDLQRRTKAMRARIREIFAPFGVHFLGRQVQPNWGHPMGTCRMGLDPATSVTDPQGRLHGHPSVYVADASVFPSSGGTGPALTVVANALRVADVLACAAHADQYARPALATAPVA